MEIRTCKDTDSAAMTALFTRVFTDSEGSGEGEMVGGLASDILDTTDRQDLHGFVAIDNERIIAAVLFSRLRFDTPIDAFILSPMAVDPAHQRQGVGTRLIHHGLEQLRKHGVALVVTYGDPAYYTRLGFARLSTRTLPPPYALSQPIGWLGQALDGGTIEPIGGSCRCVAALADPAYW